MTNQPVDLSGATPEMPPVMRFGTIVVLLQCAAMFIYAISLIVAAFRGPAADLESDSGAIAFVNIGTAVFIVIIFGFLAWVGWETLQGRPRSTGAVVLIEAIFIGVAIYMFRGGAVALGIATLISAVLVLVGVFHPQSRAYNEANYEVRKASRI